MSLSRSAPREPWFGAVPVGWSASRLKNSTESVQNGLWGEEAVGDTNDIACVRVADFDRLTLRVRQPVPTTRNLTPKERVGRQLRRDDLLIEKSGGGELQPVGVVVTYDADAPAVCSNFVARIVPRRNTWPRYFAYVHAALYSHGLNKRSIKQTTGIQNLDGDSYFNELAPFPPLPDQQRIADFLDRKTAEIDALIAKKERMIALLSEKRQAAIARVVTVGLDATVELCASDYPWLGKVPTTWTVKPLKRWLRFLNTRRIPLSSEERAGLEKTYPYYGASGIIDAVDRYLFTETTVLIAEDGANLLSRSTPLAFVASGQYWVNNHAHILLPPSGTEDFWAARLNAISIAPFVSGSAQPKLTMESLGAIMLSAPSVRDQIVLAARVRSIESQIAPTLNSLARSIELLREHRRALISEAVAGRAGLNASELATSCRAKESMSC
jgi:type I restriction enzyme S subunit